MQKYYDKTPTQGSTNPVRSDGLNQQLATIGLKIGDLTELETTDKSDLVSAINEVKQATEEISGAAEDITYTDNQGLGSTNVQGALDAVGASLTDIRGGTSQTTIDLYSYTEYSYLISSENKWVRQTGSSSAKGKCVLIPLDGVKRVTVTSNGENIVVAFLKSSTIAAGQTPAFCDDYPSRIQTDASVDVVLPSDAHYLYVATAATSGTDNRDRYTIVFYQPAKSIVYSDELEGLQITDAEMKLERGVYNSSGDWDGSYVASNAWLCTPNYLKIPSDGVFGVRTDSSATVTILRYYDEDYAFHSVVSATDLASDGFTEFTAPEGAAYVKFNFRNASSTDITPGKAYFHGNFGTEDPIYYNVRSSDNGYQAISVRVNLFNPTACDTETDSVQDALTVGADYGVLALPESYVNRGTPTRMIIYCHGAAVNYATGAVRFDSQDLDPTYWLSEGYAVMDIEGNPYDNTNEHFCMPQAYQCYKAAYEWVIRNYNIRRDGVFLGGRSMGGLMTLDIITQERGIPVIAACPNVPCVIPTWYWNYMSKARRKFCATHLGFTSQPTWSGTSPMPTAEWNCLKANFDKLALASPFWRMLNVLPDKETLFNGTNISSASTDGSANLAVYGDCRMRLRVPVKLFLVRDDDVAIPQQNGDILARIAKQSGQVFAVREFQTGGHHYDTQNASLQATVTNSYGVSITTSVVYVEMLSWWRQWEQNNI